MTVLILGAGPAGAAAARLLASWGHDVVVLARRAGGGAERSLGESLPPSCVALLSRFGISDLDAAGFLRSSGNAVRWGVRDERVEQFASGAHGYQVERSAFDAFLAREAAGAGADLRVANVTSVERDADDWTTVRFEQDGEQRTMRARWVLDCTGRTGVIARDGWRVAEPGGRTTAIVGVWETATGNPQPATRSPFPATRNPDPSHTVVESTEEGWAWSVPVSAWRRYVTLMVDPTRTPVASREGLQQAYLEQLSRTRSLARLVVGATLTPPVFARDASPYSARRFGELGVLLVGDAASFVDPLSSFGIKKALASAWLASVVVHSILASDAIAAAALALFDARERAMYDALRRSSAALARDAAEAYPTTFWASRASADGGGDPDLAFEPDVAALRNDADVLRAFEELRSREDPVRLRPAPHLRRTPRAMVRANRVVVEEHLVVPAFPDGLRYVRNVDLVRLSELAVAHDQVPDVFEAYNRAAPPVPLPDFLGALSVLIGKGFLERQVA